MGLQRPEPGPDDRSGRRRPGADLRHQQAAGAHDDPLARPAAAQRHGRRGRPDPAADPGRQDLRLRVRRQAARHVHVPPARRRNGADGDGHDGLLGHASEGSEVHAGRPRLRVPAERLRHRPRQRHAEGHDDARLQPVHLQQPRVSRASIRWSCARTTACASASAT